MVVDDNVVEIVDTHLRYFMEGYFKSELDRQNIFGNEEEISDEFIKAFKDHLSQVRYDQELFC